MKNLLVCLFMAASLALAAAPVGAAGKPAAAVARVNINTAGVADLETLPGIGKTTAEEIVRYRSEHGKFAAPGDLLRVKGVGPKTMEKIQELISIQ